MINHNVIKRQVELKIADAGSKGASDGFADIPGGLKLSLTSFFAMI